MYVSNEDYQANGSASAFEKAELRRIFQEGYAAQLSVGTVHVYIVKPDGHLLDSMHVAQAAQPDNLVLLLEKCARTLALTPRIAMPPAGSPAKPTAEPGTTLLHLVARYLDAKGNVLIPNGSGNWSEMPSEDWIPLSPAAQAKLLPARPAVGVSWEPDREEAVRLLQHFYPPTENWDSAKNAIESMTFRGRVTAIRSGVARAQLEGEYKMKHAFYHKEDNNRALGSVAGWMEFDPITHRIRTLHLVTERAEYGDARMQPYGVAVLSQ